MFKLQEINFDEDWKLLTVLIGMNDICDYCKDKVECSRRSMCNLVLFFSLRPSPSSVFLVFHTVSVLSGELHPLHGHVPGDADEWGRQISIKTFYICKNKHKWSSPDSHCQSICSWTPSQHLKAQARFLYWVFRKSWLFLYLQVPRMIVNVVQILPMWTLREVQKPTPGCLLQRFCICTV